ncbi:LTA synthase family protein [Pseudoduganella umbonata]|uniref:LTA synthase family protein n=1 Tax=Pseudoduganella umbonata TaxID=864828 RepID=A0A4P8HNE1_9BURK|nr:LTA synthase family protein [Pseudoduganella umbonata]MBB3219794.1 phosphoglycerol transferase MdoB-like AlkP superfamily enzyme [Pseudoduganella umbonata]QCP09835.1 LTA synthase family protein [Pseudoduganella umbonata]
MTQANARDYPSRPAPSFPGRATLRWWQRTGPYLNLFCLLAAGLALLSLSRIALVIWQRERVAAAGVLGDIFVQGIRADLILLGYFLAIPLALAPLLAHRRTARLWTALTAWWTTAALVFIGFMELATPQFILQYDMRPNRLFVEYLAYPAEVFGTLWHGYRLALFATVVVTMLLAALVHRVLKAASRHMVSWPSRRLLLTWPLLLLVVALQIRSTTAHRPANPALFALSGDALVNSLVINSAWSVLDAVGSMRKEAHSSEIYGDIGRDRVLAEVRSAPWMNGYRFPSAELPTLHHQQAAYRRDRPLNLVIVLEESLGATFVKSLGGLPVTPELEKLKDEGWWFEQLYATGTRSVRGIEAVVSGYAPTPARSVVKLSLAQRNFYTLALGLGRQGYQTEFVYGGEAHFDNMRGFFTGNGFQSVVDRRAMHPRFEGSWGASDEDLFDTALERLKYLHAQGKPFFSLVFTSSNHEPFEFPDGKITLHDPVKAGVNNAVKYADFALGKFITAAKQQDYWKDTVFLIVADHDNRVYGDSLVPINKFHIPGLILGADLKPRQIRTLASQIDLGPTLLSLMGVSSEHPMIGRDLARDSGTDSGIDGEVPGRAMLQFDNTFAWLEGDSATILRPGQAPLAGRYDRASGALTLASSPPPAALVERAMAHVMLPSLLYREQRYRLSP